MRLAQVRFHRLRVALNLSRSYTPFPQPCPALDSTPPTQPRPDPFALVSPQLSHLRKTLLDLLGSSHPSLTQIAKYYFLHPSKQLRPLIVLLFAQATNGLGREWVRKKWAAEVE